MKRKVYFDVDNPDYKKAYRNFRLKENIRSVQELKIKLEKVNGFLFTDTFNIEIHFCTEKDITFFLLKYS